MNVDIVTIVSKHFNNLLSKNLKEYGIENITHTSNYSEGLELIKKIKPQIVIMDLDVTNSYTTSLIQNTLLSVLNVKIITIADYYDQELKHKLIKLGIENFLTKPFQPAHLWQELDNIKESFNKVTIETDFNTDFKENYYENINTSVRDQMRDDSKIYNLDCNSDIPTSSLNEYKDSSSEFELDFDDELSKSKIYNLDCNSNTPTSSLNEYKDSSSEFELNSNNELNKPQLNTTKIKKNEYLGLPTYLDREAIYKEQQEEDEYIPQEKKTSLSKLKGVLKR